MNTKSLRKNWTKYLLLMAAAAVTLYTIVSRLHNKNDLSAEALAKQTGVADAVVTKSGSLLPEGWPDFMPVDSEHINFAYSVRFDREGFTKYTVSYFSSDSREALYKLYSDVFLAKGYTVNEKVSSLESGILEGHRWQDVLSVTISSSNDKNLVNINFNKKDET